MRLNLISHRLSLCRRARKRSYVRPPQQSQNYVPRRYIVE
jgi:hypothetical protein